jgi:hypothetical protein
VAEKINKILKIIYALIIVWCIPAFVKFGDDINFTNSIFAIVMFGAVLISLEKSWDLFKLKSVHEKLAICVMSFLFLLCMAWGKMLDTDGGLDTGNIKGMIAPVIAAPYIAALIGYIYNWIDIKASCTSKAASKKELIIYFIFLIICWGIVLLGVYPGFFAYDATDEIIQVITRQFTSHHPIFHVLYMGGIVQAGYKVFGTYNAGIFLFMLIQMALFGLGIVYCAFKMSDFGFGRTISRVMILFMGLFPVIPMCVLCSCKDSIFALVMLIWIVETYDWIIEENKRAKIIWTVLSVLMCLIRNNAVYALAVSGIFIIIFWKKNRVKFSGLLIVSIVVYFAVSALLGGIFHASSTEHQEILTVPIQQIARVYNINPKIFSDEEKEILYEYIPEESLELYRAKLSDGVKNGFSNEKYENDRSGFWKIWFSGLKKEPLSYLEAWLMTSYGYWYPDTIVDVYRGNVVYSFTYDESSYFAYETEYPGNRNSIITVIDRFYRNLSLNVYKEKVPVVSMLFSVGFVIWGMVFCIGYIIRTGGVLRGLPYILPVMTVATLLLGPTYLPRYVFFVWICMPFIIGAVISTAKIGRNKDKNEK